MPQTEPMSNYATPKKMSSDAPCLHLFTSTIRELYIADAVNVLAAPTGAIYRFRYESRYLDKATRTQWSTLSGTPVALHFSLQHPADFFKAVFMPLRSGEIVKTRIEGDMYVVHFRLGDHLALEDDPAGADKDRRGPVQAYTDAVKILLGSNHPDNGLHATLGPRLGPLAFSGDAGIAFERAVRFITSFLSFSPRIYWRIASVTEKDGQEGVQFDKKGNLRLKAGREYTLHIAHYQYRPMPGECTLTVNAPQQISLIGAPQISIRSRYDWMPVRIFVPSRDDNITCEMSISTDPPASGPIVPIPIEIDVPHTQAASGLLFGVGGTVALALPAVFATNHYVPLRASMAGLGALVVGIALWYRRRRGLLG